MPQNFWKKLKKPIFALAPMADVTDAAFRKIIAKYGKPDVMWTEFVSADGLFLGGKDALIKDLLFSKKEKPIVAQFFTDKPEMMEKAAALAAELGFDGVDINMGCPDRAVVRQGAGSALIKNPRLAREIIRAAKRGASAGRKKIPVSVKTRIGYLKNELEKWLPEILSEEPDAVIVHCRTKKEMSLVPADWSQVKKAVEIRNEMKSGALILGNGDVKNLDEAKRLVKETGADGVMLGRAIFGNPWLFNREVKQSEITPEMKLKVLVEHSKIFEKLLSGRKNFAVMKKHFKAYANGWAGAKKLRVKLMEAENAKDVKKIVDNYLKQNLSKVQLSKTRLD